MHNYLAEKKLIKCFKLKLVIKTALFTQYQDKRLHNFTSNIYYISIFQNYDFYNEMTFQNISIE